MREREGSREKDDAGENCPENMRTRVKAHNNADT